MSRILLRNGRLGLGGPVSDILVRDGWVAAVSTTGECGADTMADGDTEIVDLGDATVLPGFVDGHVHVEQWVRQRRSIDLTGSDSPAQVAERLRQHLDRHASPGSGIVWGHGIVPALWQEPPHKDQLDALGKIPVAISSIDLHTTWLSSAALALAGAPDHPTGVLRETESIQAKARLSKSVPDHELDEGVAHALADLPALGVTGLVDLAYADNLTDWRRRSQAGPVPVRIHAGVWKPWLDQTIANGHRTGEVLEGTFGRVRVGPFKIVGDGSLNTRTAWCAQPYPHPSDHGEAYGMCLVEPDDLVALMSKAWSAGLHPAVHAIGDRANTAALDAFEKVGCPGRIEHAQLVREEDMGRFAELGVVASVQPQHAVTDRDVADLHWSGRTHRAFAYRSLYEAGARLELGSDAPVSPLDPRLAIADAIYRTDNERPAWHPEQSLPLQVAFTAASAGRSEVSVGSAADLAVVAGDPREYNAGDLREMPVIATMVDGVLTYRTS